MAKRSRKKTKTTKSNWVDKIFSIKKIFVLSLIITVAAFVSAGMHQSQQVAGISTTSSNRTPTPTAPPCSSSHTNGACPAGQSCQYDSNLGIHSCMTDPNAVLYHIDILLFADKNGNGKMDKSEYPIYKDFKVTLVNNQYPKGKTLLLHSPNCDACDYAEIKSYYYSNKITLNVSQITNWKFTGYTYFDKDKHRTPVTDIKKPISLVGGFGLPEGFSINQLGDNIYVGLKQK